MISTFIRRFFAFTLFCCLGLSHVNANEKWHNKGGGKEAFKELNLTDDQKSKMKELRKASKNEMKVLRQTMKDRREKLAQSMAGKASDDELKKDFASLQEAKAKWESAKFDQRLKMRKVLTEEQRAKFASFMNEKKKSFKKDKLRDEDEE